MGEKKDEYFKINPQRSRFATDNIYNSFANGVADDINNQRIFRNTSAILNTLNK